jgi:Zn-finger nucleic acid-binding protein
MNCPKCIGKLGKKTLVVRREHTDKALKGAVLEYELELDECFICAGVWFDQHELDRYMRDGLKTAPAEEKKLDIDFQPNAKEGQCPVCNVAMKQHGHEKNSRVIIDRCETCGGIWLDRGELKRLEGAAGSWKQTGLLGGLVKGLLGR